MEYLENGSFSCKRCSPDSELSSLSAGQPLMAVSSFHKRKAGRKKFKETRHPVYRGVRQKRGNKWVSEIREPSKQSRIWLGTFLSPEMAARAYDVAVLALRGKSAALNFPDSTSILPRAKSCSPKDIQIAAFAAAEAFKPTMSTNFDHQPSEFSSSSQVFDENDEKTRVLDHGRNLEITNVDDNSGFMDEEALFNMPGLLHSMAEGSGLRFCNNRRKIKHHKLVNVCNNGCREFNMTRMSDKCSVIFFVFECQQEDMKHLFTFYVLSPVGTDSVLV